MNKAVMRVVVLCLVISNILVALRFEWIGVWFFRPAVLLSSLTVEAAPNNPNALVLVDHLGEFSVIGGRPLPKLLQLVFNHVALNAVVRSGQIVLWDRPAGSSDAVCLGVWPARLQWQPVGSSAVRFVIPIPSSLSPGNHQFGVTLVTSPATDTAPNQDARVSGPTCRGPEFGNVT